MGNFGGRPARCEVYRGRGGLTEPGGLPASKLEAVLEHEASTCSSRVCQVVVLCFSYSMWSRGKCFQEKMGKRTSAAGRSEGQEVKTDWWVLQLGLNF